MASIELPPGVTVQVRPSGEGISVEITAPEGMKISVVINEDSIWHESIPTGETVPAVAAEPGTWQPANNGTGKRRWFLYREAPNVADRYHETADGQLIRYGSMEAAQRAADSLNAR